MRLRIEHETDYRYREAVRFSPHRLMLMPYEGHDVTVRHFDLHCTPEADVSWLQDVFGNSVAIARFAQASDQLRIVSQVLIERDTEPETPIPLSPEARRLPLTYGALERIDLAPTLAHRHPEDEPAIQAWCYDFVHDSGNATWPLLESMNRAISNRFEYRVRLEPGIQSPAETLRLGSGTCRDFALLMMEAARTQGLAARFVSGYLFDPTHDESLHGTGHTHAWVQIYLPGPGWVEFDPTNGMVNSDNLIRVAVARDPEQAIPVEGAFTGPSDAALDMNISVRVETEDDGVLAGTGGPNVA